MKSQRNVVPGFFPATTRIAPETAITKSLTARQIILSGTTFRITRQVGASGIGNTILTFPIGIFLVLLAEPQVSSRLGYTVGGVWKCGEHILEKAAIFMA